MTTTLLLVLWWVSGCASGWLWFRFERDDFNSTYPCPSPLRLLGIVACGIGGPVLFGFTALLMFMAWASHTIRHRDSWWSRPICGKRGDAQ